jgi:hypothetical protein
MAATVQSDPYQALSRKVGYSVGLEFIVDRVQKLTSLYVEEREVSFVAWSQLVEEFGRKKGLERARIEIANFYSALGLIRVIGREIQVLPGLDALSILRRHVTDAEGFELAFRFLLTFYVLEADGDIFLNCLDAEFHEPIVRQRLEAMVQEKWSRISRVIKNPGLQRKVWDVVAIKSERGVPKEGKSSGSPFSMRSGPSPFARRQESFDALPNRNFKVEDSYLDKVVPTRKGWATDLGCFSNNKITETGRMLLTRLADGGLKAGDAYCIWPYNADLLALRIKPEELGIKGVTEWDVMCRIAAALNPQVVPTDAITESAKEECLALLEHFHELYKQGSKARGSIRHQLPLYVAKPLVVARSVAKGVQIPPVIEIVNEEARSKRRKVSVTHIRGTEGALVFKVAR